MENMRRWINYDWFKLVVALILLVIFIVLLMQQSQSVTGATNTNQIAVASTLQPSATAPQAAEATLPAPTQAPTSTPTQEATSVPTQAPTQAPTPTPAQEATPVPTQAPTATAQPEQPTATLQTTGQTSSGDCSKALPTRLEVGKKARVAANLYFRKEPGMDKTILKTNLPGTQLEIIDGPMCIPYGEGVYRWWNVKTTTGETGWSAEGSLLGKNYFLDPLT
jgi:cytoskeletal protein RodZ